MSEKFTVICDYCQNNITSSNTYPTYRIRMTEESRCINLPAEMNKKRREIPYEHMHFCNVDHLKEWLDDYEIK